MKVEESKPDNERLRLIDNVIYDAASLLGVDNNKDSPGNIVSKIYDVVVDLVFDKPTPLSGEDNPHLLLGALWGS